MKDFRRLSRYQTLENYAYLCITARGMVFLTLRMPSSSGWLDHADGHGLFDWLSPGFVVVVADPIMDD